MRRNLEPYILSVIEARLSLSSYVLKGSINSINTGSHYIRLYHFSFKLPPALQQIIHTPQEYAKLYEWPIYQCQDSSPSPPTQSESFSHTQIRSREWVKRDSAEMRVGPGCQRSSPHECAKRRGSLRLSPCPLSVPDKTNLQRQHLSPPLVPKRPRCHASSLQLSETLCKGPSAMNGHEGRAFFCPFKLGASQNASLSTDRTLSIVV